MSGIGDTIWAALPVPGILVDGDDLVSDLNTAAEGFLNLSSRSVRASVSAPWTLVWKTRSKESALLWMSSLSSTTPAP